jgi:hypothetical protein
VFVYPQGVSGPRVFRAIVQLIAMLYPFIAIVIGSIWRQGSSAVPSEEVFFLPGLYSGLTNQRFSFYHSVLVAAARNWTLVLPSWKFGYNDYIDGKTLPFEYFYTIDRDLAGRSTHLKSFRFVSEMPRERLGACLTQLQCTSFNDCKWPTLPIMDGRAAASKVVCIDSDSSYYTLSKMAAKFYNTHSLYDLPILYELRNALVINPTFTDIVHTITHRISKTFGTKQFISVHYRIEPDFLELCQKAARESWQDGEKRICSDGEEAIYEKLAEFKVPYGTVLMVMNGVKEDYFLKMPKLCGTGECHVSHSSLSAAPTGAPGATGAANGDSSVFKLPAHCESYICVRKEQFWSEREAPTEYVHHEMSLSMVDYALASRATLFLGNMYSTMSKELYYSFVGRGAKAVMFNRPCSAVQGACP